MTFVPASQYLQSLKQLYPYFNPTIFPPLDFIPLQFYLDYFRSSVEEGNAVVDFIYSCQFLNQQN